MPPMPPMPPGIAGREPSSFGLSEIIASVVIMRPATEAAFCNAYQETLVGSMMPASIMSTKVSVGCVADDREYAHELAVATCTSLQYGPHTAQSFWQIPSFEGRTVTQCSRLPLQNSQVVPGVVDDLVPAKMPRMDTNHGLVMHNDHSVCVRSHRDLFAQGHGIDTISVAVVGDQKL